VHISYKKFVTVIPVVNLGLFSILTTSLNNQSVFTIDYHGCRISAVAPPHEFMPLLRCYYPLQENTKYEIGLASSGVVYIPHVVEVCPAVLDLKHADVETGGQT
jgi:hypothetical protein